ncbi:MAG: PAS domain-containing protein [Desulfobulbaceae bacterium]|nr:PAS domain-containing protein [Desulfobulbaceae bacterium]
MKRRICVRCKKQLLPQEDLRTEKVITQGICSRCTVQLTQGIPQNFRELLNIIPEPVLVLDCRGVVKTANDCGMKFLGKNPGEIEGCLGGEVLGCAFANLPEGCGKTEHCRTCAIRNIVMDTLTRGRGYSNVPAFQNIKTPRGERIMRFYISTEKIADRILLRIDDILERATA